MLLQIYFEVKDENAQAFEEMFDQVYVPAMQVQAGYIGSRLLKTFPTPDGEVPDTAFNYQMNLVFDTEENRVKWAESPEHDVAFPAAKALAEDWDAQKYDVVGEAFVLGLTPQARVLCPVRGT